MIFRKDIPNDCTCVWLRVSGDDPGFVLHQVSSTCKRHRDLRWYQPTFDEVDLPTEKGAEE